MLKTFSAAKMNAVFYNLPIIKTFNKDRISKFATFICIYQFTCLCGASYIGRETQQVHHHIAEHYLSWLTKGLIRVIKSSIPAHLVNTRYKVDLSKAFKVIHNIPFNSPHSLRVRLLLKLSVSLLTNQTFVFKRRLCNYSLPCS